MNKKIMVCLDLNNESIELLKKDIKNWDLKKIDEIHFVHGFQLQSYADAFYFSSYPPENQYDDIEKSVKEVMKNLEDEIFRAEDKTEILNECIISASPKQSLAKYAKSNDIDIMVIGTRGKHGIQGLFASSFAEYMVRYASCELKIIRGL